LINTIFLIYKMPLFRGDSELDIEGKQLPYEK